jgi:hypothetical protein
LMMRSSLVPDGTYRDKAVLDTGVPT